MTGTGGVPHRVVAGRYRLVEELGRGGMGVVWTAVDELLHRDVAIKEVKVPDDLDDEEQRIRKDRAVREARAAARISHRNVVTIFDVVVDDGRPWIVMELVRARSLGDVLDEDGRLTPAEAAGIGIQVLAALSAAKDAEVLHRDIKPSNILMGPQNRIVLTDFGIATVVGSQTLTATGMLVGSPEYLAPERALGRRPGPASDIWSLGVTLYQAVEGRSPFRRTNPIDTLNAVLQEAPDPLRHAGPLTPAIEAMLAKDPAVRPDEEACVRLLSVAVQPDIPTPLPPVGPGFGTGDITVDNPQGPHAATVDSYGNPPFTPNPYAQTPRTPVDPYPNPTAQSGPSGPQPVPSALGAPGLPPATPAEPMDTGTVPLHGRHAARTFPALLGVLIVVALLIGLFVWDPWKWVGGGGGDGDNPQKSPSMTAESTTSSSPPPSVTPSPEASETDDEVPAPGPTTRPTCTYGTDSDGDCRPRPTPTPTRTKTTPPPSSSKPPISVSPISPRPSATVTPLTGTDKKPGAVPKPAASNR